MADFSITPFGDTFAAGGQTLVSYSSLYGTMGQYAVISAIYPVANTFLLAGNLGV